MPGRREPVHRGKKSHRLARVAPPVGGVEVHACGGFTGYGGDDGGGLSARLERGNGFEELLAARIEIGAVKRKIRVDKPTEDLALFEFPGNRFQRLGIAGQSHGAWAIDRGDREAGCAPGDEFLRLPRGQGDGKHFSFWQHLLHDAATVKHHAQRIIEAQRASDLSSGEFADAVAENGIRLDAPGVPEFRQRELERKNTPVCHGHLAQARGAFFHGELAQQWTDSIAVARACTVGAELSQQRVAPRNRIAEHGFIAQQLTTHAPPLRALSAEDKNERTMRCRVGVAEIRIVFSSEERREILNHFLFGMANDREPVVMMHAASAHGVADVAQ